MQVGLIGLPQAGKKTLMRLLTQVSPQALAPPRGAGLAAAAGGAVPGICPVRDPRVEKLSQIYKPAKTTPATIQYLLMPDMTKDSATNRELLKALLKVDVLAHVVRAFEDDTVFHLDGSVDPVRDIETVHSELVLNDLIFLEKRLERIAKDQQRRSGADTAQEQELLTRLQVYLNEHGPLRTMKNLDDQQLKLLSGAPLLTRKPYLVILNAGEDQTRDTRRQEALQATYAAQGAHVVQVSAKIEEELAQLDDPAERAAFLKELGITASAIDGLTRASYDALGLISYFTVGTDEVRAWTVRRGASAAEAGGAIHSDIERGFIRAEHISYADLLALGSEHAVAEAGKLALKSKEYVVQDGDILNFRFNV